MTEREEPAEGEEWVWAVWPEDLPPKYEPPPKPGETGFIPMIPVRRPIYELGSRRPANKRFIMNMVPPLGEGDEVHIVRYDGTNTPLIWANEDWSEMLAVDEVDTEKKQALVRLCNVSPSKHGKTRWISFADLREGYKCHYHDGQDWVPVTVAYNPKA